MVMSACSLPPKYTGDKFARTASVDVFYQGDNVSRAYKVIGHLSSHHYDKSIIKENFVKWGKQVGADAIIISGDEAVVVKYN